MSPAAARIMLSTRKLVHLCLRGTFRGSVTQHICGLSLFKNIASRYRFDIA